MRDIPLTHEEIQNVLATINAVPPLPHISEVDRDRVLAATACGLRAWRQGTTGIWPADRAGTYSR